LSDLDGSMSTAYGVTEPGAEKSPRKSVLIGTDGKVAVAYDTVKPPEHPDQVLADLDKLT